MLELPAGYVLHPFGRDWVVSAPDGTTVPNAGDWTSCDRPFVGKGCAIIAARRHAGLPTRRTAS